MLSKEVSRKEFINGLLLLDDCLCTERENNMEMKKKEQERKIAEWNVSCLKLEEFFVIDDCNLTVA